jgi:hypothetical protein
MNFIEAIKLARQGKIMGYKDADEDIMYLSEHGEYSSTNECLVGVDTTKLEEVYIEDILRDDWMEVEPKIELYSFEEALNALKKGRTIKRASVPKWTYNLSVCNFNEVEIMANDWIIEKRDK